MTNSTGRITINMTFGQCAELHDWFDVYFPDRWSYMGSQTYLSLSLNENLSDDDRHALYKAQRVAWAVSWNTQGVTNHFVIRDLNEGDLVTIRLCWKLIGWQIQSGKLE